MVDDFAVEGDDGDFLGSDLDDGGDLLVGVILLDGDAFPEQVDATVGADVADYFDPSSGGEPRWRLIYVLTSALGCLLCVDHRWWRAGALRWPQPTRRKPGLDIS